MDESIKFIRETIPSGSTLVVGVSSGPDSMCLLNLLYSKVEYDMEKEYYDEEPFDVLEEELAE